MSSARGDAKEVYAICLSSRASGKREFEFDRTGRLERVEAENGDRNAKELLLPGRFGRQAGHVLTAHQIHDEPQLGVVLMIHLDNADSPNFQAASDRFRRAHAQLPSLFGHQYLIIAHKARCLPGLIAVTEFGYES